MAPALRLGVAVVVWLTLLAVGVGFAADLLVLRQASATVFLLLELGVAPALLARPMRASRFTLIALVSGLSAVVLTGITMAASHVWQPGWLMVAVVVATVVMLTIGTVRAVRDLRATRLPGSAVDHEEARAGSARELPWAALGTVVGLALVVVASYLVRGDPSRGGLFSVEGPLWWLGLAVLAATTVAAYATRRSPALPLLAMSGVVVLSQAVAYGTPTMVSAARHVGVVDSIRVNGGTTTGVDIFQSWAGLFSGVAWVADVAGIRDVMVIATWWPVMITPLIGLAATVLARRFIAHDGRAWFAGALFALTITLNTIYFSPQSLGTVLALCVAALALGARLPATSTRDLSGRVGPLRLAAILGLGCTLAVTHQISPYLAVAALVVFVVFGLVRPWWLPVLVLVPAVGWAVANRSVLGTFLIPSAFGNVFDNAAPPSRPDATLGTSVTNLIAFGTPAALLVLIGLAALMVLLVGPRDRRTWALVLAAASPVSLIIATNYGAEGIFRVTLFAAPWLCILAAQLPYERLLRPFGDRARQVGVGLLAVVVVLVLAVNVYGNTALDWNRVASKDTTLATEAFEEQAAPGSALLIPGNGNATPGGRTANYLQLQYVTREALGGYADTSDSYDAVADERELTSKFVTGWTGGGDYYVLVSDVMGAYDERYGFQSYDDFEELSAAFAADGRWEAVTTSPTATLYVLSDPDAARG